VESPAVRIGLIEGVSLLPNPIFDDERGRLQKVFFSDTENKSIFSFEVKEAFFTFSQNKVFRGLHFQSGPHAAAKIITLIKGEIIDFLLDLRLNSTSRHILQIIPMSDIKPFSIYVPKGVAHGYLTVGEQNIVNYLMDVSFCQTCDNGVNAIQIATINNLMHSYKTQIISPRDLSLPNLGNVQLKEDDSCIFLS
jgi:dTDP-4-dehydrorhamnose 3,5-epimerase-like enzyme